MTGAHSWNSERPAAFCTNQEKALSVSEYSIGSIVSQRPLGTEQLITAAGAENDRRVIAASRQSVLPMEHFVSGLSLANLIGDSESYIARRAVLDKVHCR